MERQFLIFALRDNYNEKLRGEIMAITMEEAALAWARLLMRAEQAEARNAELESELKKLKDEKSEATK